MEGQNLAQGNKQSATQHMVSEGVWIFVWILVGIAICCIVDLLWRYRRAKTRKLAEDDIEEGEKADFVTLKPLRYMTLSIRQFLRPKAMHIGNKREMKEVTTASSGKLPTPIRSIEDESSSEDGQRRTSVAANSTIPNESDTDDDELRTDSKDPSGLLTDGHHLPAQRLTSEYFAAKFPTHFSESPTALRAPLSVRSDIGEDSVLSRLPSDMRLRQRALAIVHDLAADQSVALRSAAGTGIHRPRDLMASFSGSEDEFGSPTRGMVLNERATSPSASSGEPEEPAPRPSPVSPMSPALRDTVAANLARARASSKTSWKMSRCGYPIPLLPCHHHRHRYV